MIEWLKRVCCNHTWKTQQTIIVSYIDSYGRETGENCLKYTLRCEKCGNLKFVRDN